MKNQFNGDRLKKARIYRGLTVAELSEKVGCQRQTLSMYEISKSQPTDESIVKKLSNELHFPVEFFYEHPYANIKGSVYFRSLMTTNKKYRNEQIVKMDFLSQIYGFLKDYIDFPKFEPLNLPESISPEEAAYELRKAWNLGNGPIENIITVVEQHGILVTSFSTSTDDVDAFSQLVGTQDDSTFLIAYSNNKTSAARIHFDIAHELGHICLHPWSEDIEEISKEEFKQREQQANTFAAAFLLPSITFGKDAASGPHSIAYYKKLKKKWKVSIAAMILRAKNLDIITKEEYQSLIRILQRRGQRKEEPLDDTLLTASPTLLKSAIVLLLQEDIFTPEEFMQNLSFEYNLSINPSEVEYLLALPMGTLAPSNIMDFKTIQLKQNK